MTFDFTMQLNRKGIYQEFDALGNVRTDERWQAIALPDGSIHVENETVRIKPSPEPRSDSATYLLDRELRLLDFSIHGLLGKRESRVCVLGEARAEATLCWRHEGAVHERKIAWDDAFELDYASPLFNMITIWRSKLQPGQSRACQVWWLNPLTFEPRLMNQIYANHGQERHATRFGQKTLWHYTLDFGGSGSSISHMWCDDEGVIFDFAAASGGGYRLTATDIPL